MDDLEKSASAHCSHLSKTVRDWIAFMVDMLVEMGDEIPSRESDRYVLYKSNKIPEAVYLQYDTEATQKAMAKLNGK